VARHAPCHSTQVVQNCAITKISSCIAVHQQDFKRRAVRCDCCHKVPKVQWSKILQIVAPESVGALVWGFLLYGPAVSIRSFPHHTVALTVGALRTIAPDGRCEFTQSTVCRDTQSIIPFPFTVRIAPQTTHSCNCHAHASERSFTVELCKSTHWVGERIHHVGKQDIDTHGTVHSSTTSQTSWTK
jgi:hypothetical protein